MKVAAIYRVSTDKQVRREGEETLPLQRAAVREFVAHQSGWQMVKEYAEEGVSGFKVSADDRDVLQQAFKDAKAGLWQILVVFKADRLSRNAFEYPVVIDRFRKIGCEIWSVKDAAGGKLLALDTQMDRFVRFLEGWQAETESKNTSIRVAEAMLQLAKQGKWSGGPTPYGYKLNEGRRPRSEAPALLIDEEQAHIIRLMVDLYLNDRMGCMLIANELNRRQVPNPKGRPWDDQKVRRILQNPIIAGLPAYNRNRQSGEHFTRKNPYDLDQFILPRDEGGNLKPVPALQIVPLDRWLTLLGAMKTARTAPSTGKLPHTVTATLRSTDALLTGLVYCGHCGARLSADASPAKSKRKDGTVAYGKRVYYVCQTHLHKGRQFCGGQRTYGCRRLEQAMLDQLKHLLTMLDAQELSQLLLGGLERGRGELDTHLFRAGAEVDKAGRVLDGWLARMDAFLADPGNSPYTEEMLVAKIREARTRAEAARAALQGAQKECHTSWATPEQVKLMAEIAPHWWAAFEASSTEEKKVAMRDLVERVEVRREGVEILFRVDLNSFLPKARQLAVGVASATGSSLHWPRPSYLAPSL